MSTSFNNLIDFSEIEKLFEKIFNTQPVAAVKFDLTPLIDAIDFSDKSMLLNRIINK